jgi:hypothetical protein
LSDAASHAPAGLNATQEKFLRRLCALLDMERRDDPALELGQFALLSFATQHDLFCLFVEYTLTDVPRCYRLTADELAQIGTLEEKDIVF